MGNFGEKPVAAPAVAAPHSSCNCVCDRLPPSFSANGGSNIFRAERIDSCLRQLLYLFPLRHQVDAQPEGAHVDHAERAQAGNGSKDRIS